MARKFGNLGGALRYAFPDVEWSSSFFAVTRKKSVQRWLKLQIENLVPGVEIVEDYLHPELNWGKLMFSSVYLAENIKHMELDLWLPAYRIGIEYQGKSYHE